jgi:hypothetical protein
MSTHYVDNVIPLCHYYSRRLHVEQESQRIQVEGLTEVFTREVDGRRVIVLVDRDGVEHVVEERLHSVSGRKAAA